MRTGATVSFVIPVRNDVEGLERCLRSVIANRGPLGHAEMLVIDNGSTDGSAALARRLGAKVLVIEGRKVSELRNVGAQHASGEVLAFVDADNEITSQWTRSALELLRDSSVGAAGAHYHAPPDGTWVQQAYGLLRGRPQGQHEAEWLGSGNLAVKRDVFEAIGGFDTSLETCEDVDLCMRIRGRGYRIVSDARLKSVHHGDPRTLGEVFKGERWRGRDNLRVSFRKPISWRAMPSALIPVIDTLMLAVVLVGVAAALAGVPAAGGAAGSALLVIAGFTALKVRRAVRRDPLLRGVRLMQAFLVATVYDLARALALVSPASHRRILPSVAASES